MQHKFQTQQRMLTFLKYQLHPPEKLLPYLETPRQRK